MQEETVTKEDIMLHTPVWSRKRPLHLKATNERSEAIARVCSGFNDINTKKKDVEELKRQLLEEEIVFKRQLYHLQLQAATKEVEIKTEILCQVKGIYLINTILSTITTS